MESEIEEIRRKKMLELTSKAFEPDIPQEVVHINNIAEFNEIVETYKDNLIVIDYWAEWCGPCKMFGPIFEQSQKEYKDKGVIFLKVNVDHNQQIAGQFNIMSIPTTMYIKNKTILHQQPGALPPAAFKEILNKILDYKPDLDYIG